MIKKEISDRLSQAKNPQSLKSILEEVCAAYGTVTSSRVFIDKYDGGFRAVCLVEMANDEELRHALHDSGAPSFGYNAMLFDVPLPGDFNAVYRF